MRAFGNSNRIQVQVQIYILTDTYLQLFCRVRSLQARCNMWGNVRYQNAACSLRICYSNTLIWQTLLNTGSTRNRPEGKKLHVIRSAGALQSSLSCINLSTWQSVPDVVNIMAMHRSLSSRTGTILYAGQLMHFKKKSHNDIIWTRTMYAMMKVCLCFY